MSEVHCEAVLFDLDDTLLDHRGAAADALRHWGTDVGLALAPEELAAAWQVLESRYYARYQRGELTKLEQRRARIRALLDPVRLGDDEADAMFDAYWSRYRSAWRAFPDAEAAVRAALDAGLRVGLLTNGDAADQQRKVDATFLAGLDLPLFASSELPGAKPDRSAFEFSCAALQVEPGRCLMVGDSYVNDIEGALGAGLSAALLDRSEATWELPRRARLIRSLAELRFG
ncbi:MULTISPECIES: HAD family hydrolase [Mycolicibacterium]|uniref:L-2-haloacid dehalogenase n=1 Tax=Mycolicibacterium chitae TaxID=1792 RepID=A0A3S4T414_MYCCI|nr:HAD family hydrolase [Mycolicibacterium chitae]MCV7109110.1 HAD family hydrolase [Mycolicibacterium chitae]VEG50310.1 L-2-haloacid dehalogenase [Mycolicibacterium chitae]